MAITPLPTPPSRDDPANFATEADAFLGALPTFATEANALAADVESDKTAAAASASAASTSASNAASSASAASTSASNAASSAAAAAASYDAFDDRFLGAKASDPSTDNDGNALITGALYFNTTANEMRVYSGAAWLATYLPAGNYATLSGAETLTNKTISADNNTLSGLAASSFVMSNASGNIDGAAAAKSIPAGAVVGTTDAQTLTNKTISGSSNTISNINLASQVTGTLPVANGGTGGSTQSDARTGLGASAVGSNFFTLTNPSAVTFPRINADNSVSALDAATFRSAIGAGVGSVTNVSGTGTVQGLSLSGSVSSSGSLTLGGSLSAINLASQVTGTLPVGNGGSGTSYFAANNVLLGNGSSAFQVVAPGASGNVLRSNGSTWTSQSLPASGLNLIATLTASNSATLSFEGLFTSTYDEYIFEITRLRFVTSGVLFLLRRTAGSYITANPVDSGKLLFTDANYNVGYNYQNTSGGRADLTSYGVESYTAFPSGTASGLSGIVRVSNPLESGNKHISWYLNFFSSSSSLYTSIGVSGNPQTATYGRSFALDGIQFLSNSGVNFYDGSIRLYGLAKS